MKKFVITFAALALAAVASAAEKHTITLYQPSVIGGQQLKAGEYRIELDGNKMMVKNGKQTIETGIKVEAADSKFSSTSVRYLPNNQVTEIKIGGTKTKVVLEGGSVSAN